MTEITCMIVGFRTARSYTANPNKVYLVTLNLQRCALTILIVFAFKFTKKLSHVALYILLQSC